MGSKNNPKGRENELVVQNLNGELLIYDLTINKAYCLNTTSAMIWNLCDGNNSVSDISRQLSKKLKRFVPEDLVYLALNDFKKDGLLNNDRDVTNKFEGLSRREVIRRIGLASMIALPVVSSLVAPTAAMAQSGPVCGRSCTSNANCASPCISCLGRCSVGGTVCGPVGNACGPGGAGTCVNGTCQGT